MTRVADLMSRDIVSVTEDTAVEEAARRARQAGIHHLMVVGERGLVGMLCTCDLRGPAKIVSECMSTAVVSIEADVEIGGAAEHMRRQRVGSLAVTSQGRVVGIVTASDFHRSGIPLAITGKTFCTACGAMHHVRPFHGSTDVAFCIECLEGAAHRELGGDG